MQATVIRSDVPFGIPLANTFMGQVKPRLSLTSHCLSLTFH